ncbi:MAG: hypothetical protein M0R80_24385 [Proteobacteria bacterium]|nr:hypothetical protein [Pseudomonadota bacterium]
MKIVIMVFVASIVACTGDPKLVDDAGPDADTDTDADSDTDTDSDSDSDTDSDTVPWSTPEVAGVLLSVWGSSADDVYAGGEGQTLLHGSGSTWELVPLPEGFNAGDIHGSAWNSVYVVNGWEDFRVVRYDGAVWSDTTCGVCINGLRAVWVSGIDDVLGITNNCVPMEPGVCVTAVYRFDGEAWSSIWGHDLMTETDGQPDFEDMTGTADGHVFAVGASNLDEVIAIASDGTDWWTEEIPEPSLHGVWALDAANVWAVGDGGAVLRRGDTAWDYEDTPTSARLDGVFGWSEAEQIAVGDGVILNKSGAVWGLQDVPTAGAQLHGVWGATPDDVYVVGELDGGALILHYDGAAWSVVYGG